MSEIAITVNLVIKTCNYGHVYAIPNWVISKYQCPMCAVKEYELLQKQGENQVEECYRLGRVIRGLRGALNRKSKT